MLVLAQERSDDVNELHDRTLDREIGHSDD